METKIPTEILLQEVVRTPQELMTEQLNKELMEWKEEEHKKMLEQIKNNEL